MSVFSSASKFKIGVVLSGGGAKGAYQAGVFETLSKLGLTDNIAVISGTSIGALNGVLLALCDEDKYGGVWNRVDYDDFIRKADERGKLTLKNVLMDLLSVEKNDLTPAQILHNHEGGLFSQDGISEFIQSVLDLKKIYTCGKTVYACAYNIDKKRPEYFKLNDYPVDKVMKILLASSAVPYIFPPVEIDGMHYADGGVDSSMYGGEDGDLTPIKPLYGYPLDLTIVVHLDPANKDEQEIGRHSPTIHIYPSKPLEVIRGTGTFDFTKTAIKERMELGYRDSMVALAPIVVGLLKGRPISRLTADYYMERDRKIS